MPEYTPRQLLEIELESYERLLNTLTPIYMSLLEEEGCRETEGYVRDRINCLFEQWLHIKQKLLQMPPIIDLTHVLFEQK